MFRVSLNKSCEIIHIFRSSNLDGNTRDIIEAFASEYSEELLIAW
jgi:hypothetical protein